MNFIKLENKKNLLVATVSVKCVLQKDFFYPFMAILVWADKISINSMFIFSFLIYFTGKPVKKFSSVLHALLIYLWLSNNILKIDPRKQKKKSLLISMQFCASWT